MVPYQAELLYLLIKPCTQLKQNHNHGQLILQEGKHCLYAELVCHQQHQVTDTQTNQQRSRRTPTMVPEEKMNFTSKTAVNHFTCQSHVLSFLSSSSL